MLGFIIGTACLIGLVKVAKRGCYGGGGCGYGYGGGGCGYGRGGGCGRGWGGGWGRWGHHHHHGHWGHHHHHGPGGGPDAGPQGEHNDAFAGMRRWILRGVYSRLDATPGQEKVIAQSFDEIATALRNARGEMREFRGDVGKAFTAQSFDETVMGNAFARQDEAIANVRKAITGALARVHEALDERQRRIFSEIVAEGGFRPWGGRGGPYRG